MSSKSLYDLATSPGIGKAQVFPHYTPPNIAWSAIGVQLRPGRYYMAGPRVRSQYIDTENMSLYYDVTQPLHFRYADTAVGGYPTDTWYSVFLMESGDVQLLPSIKVDTVTTSGSNTVITPARENSGAENGWVTASGIWNDYRAIWLAPQPADPTTGTVLSIVETLNGTPDQVVVAGDHNTAGLGLASFAGENNCGLDIVPTDVCVYLGRIYLQSDGTVRKFTKSGWAYVYEGNNHYVNSHRDDNMTYSWTAVHQYVPPNATTALVYFSFGEDGTNSRSGFRGGLSPNNSSHALYYEWNPEGSYAWRSYEQYGNYIFNYNQNIGNFAWAHRYGTWYTPEYAHISFHGFTE